MGTEQIYHFKIRTILDHFSEGFLDSLKCYQFPKTKSEPISVSQCNIEMDPANNKCVPWPC